MMFPKGKVEMSAHFCFFMSEQILFQYRYGK